MFLLSSIPALLLLLLPLALAASTYPPSGDDFPNPERGFYIAKGYDPGEHQMRQLDPALRRRARENGITLLNMSWVLSEFRDRPLSPDMLDRIRADFARPGRNMQGPELEVEFLCKCLHS